MDSYQSLNNYNNSTTNYELPLLQNSYKAHPCTHIFISYSIGEEYKSASYNTRELYDIIKKGNCINPLTKLPFSPYLIQKIELYMKCIEKLPEYNIQSVNSSNIFSRWIKSLKKNSNLSNEEKELVDIEARCFLQPEELVDIFQDFKQNGSLAIREEAEKYLKDTGKQWILRNCSLKDTDKAKAYALTILYGGVPYSFPIVHKIGDGFYFNVGLNRGDSIEKTFTFTSFHITIIDLIKTVLKDQLALYVQ